MESISIKPFVFGATLLIIVTMVGCASVETGKNLNRQRLTTSSARPIANINADVWGIYLFNIPLVTGKYRSKQGDFLGIDGYIVDQPDIACTFFSDTVNLDYVCDITTEKGGELGGNAVVDLRSKRTDSWLYFTLVLFYRRLQFSGNAVK